HQYYYTVPYYVESSIKEKLDIPGVKPLFLIFLGALALGTAVLFIGGPALVLFPIAFIIGFSFPSLMWISYVYSYDIYEPEPGRAVLIVLTWGMLSVIPALMLELPFTFNIFVAAAIGAPIVEEFVKPLGIYAVKKEIDNELDGIIYGVSAGMGFAMVENIFYELAAVFAKEPTAAWGFTTLVRGLGSIVVHGVGAGLIGYAYARYIHGKSGFSTILWFYGFAVLFHAIWNGTVSILELYIAEIAALLTFIGFIIIFPLIGYFIIYSFLKKASEPTYEITAIPPPPYYQNYKRYQ
ncbi:MAG: PrsW family intramembrane metalloprotease, partial [Candidatus Thermoplasmatota archaeon]